MDPITRAELGRRWAYRATVEWSAAHRFERLAVRLAAVGVAAELVAIARAAVRQEHAHVELCAGLAARFGVGWSPGSRAVDAVAPPTWSAYDQVVYEVVAFCCVTETSNTALVAGGLDAIDDPEVARAARRILADEVQHSRLGWQFLAMHPLDRAQATGLAAHLPIMLAGAVRVELFRPHAQVGDEAIMARFGSSPIVDRRATFVDGMRAVLLPGLAAAGVDVAAGAALVDGLEAQARAA